MKTNSPKIIIIDNEISCHNSYRFCFDAYTDYTLKGIYTSVKGALIDYEHASPDIIISEVALPDVDGIEGIKLFREKDPNVKIIMISADSDLDNIKNAFQNNANGYLSKPIESKSLHHALSSVQHEGATMSNDIVKKVIAMFQRKRYSIFSERENQILDYLCQGATYKSIANKLFVTPSAVNFHIQNIYEKLNVNSKSEAFLKLRELEYDM